MAHMILDRPLSSTRCCSHKRPECCQNSAKSVSATHLRSEPPSCRPQDEGARCAAAAKERQSRYANGSSRILSSHSPSHVCVNTRVPHATVRLFCFLSSRQSQNSSHSAGLRITLNPNQPTNQAIRVRKREAERKQVRCRPGTGTHKWYQAVGNSESWVGGFRDSFTEPLS